MPTPAVVATQLTDHSSRPFGLSVGGFDVIKGASGFGARLDTVKVSERGPGGVSSISFTVDDPTGVWFPVAGAEVYMFDTTDQHTIFRGIVDPIDSSPGFGGQGRSIAITGTGVEAYLDWLKVEPAYTQLGLQGPQFLAADLARWVALNNPPMPLNALFYTGTSENGSASQPLGRLGRIVDGSNTFPAPVTGLPTVTGTLRECFRTLMAPAQYTGIFGTIVSAADQFFTVDFDYNWRLWKNTPTDQPDDYTTLTVNDTYAGAIVASDLSYSIAYGDGVHMVYVAGTGAGTGWFYDGSGVTTGPRDIISDTTITTAAGALLAANGYFTTNSPVLRGSFGIEDFTPAATVHAGSLLSLTDTASGATGSYRIFSIDKTFQGNGRQNWIVGFGGLPPSSVNLVRRLTRATLS